MWFKGSVLGLIHNLNPYFTFTACYSTLSVGLSELNARKTDYWSLAMTLQNLYPIQPALCHYCSPFPHFFTCWCYTLSFFLTELLYGSNAPNLYSQWHGSHTFSISPIFQSFQSAPIFQTDFHAARQNPVLQWKALAARPRRLEKMSVPLFMLPSLTLWCR